MLLSLLISLGGCLGVFIFQDISDFQGRWEPDWAWGENISTLSPCQKSVEWNLPIKIFLNFGNYLIKKIS